MKLAMRWPAALLFATALHGQYAGSHACRACHAEKFEQQSKSGHARALALAPKGSPGQWAFGAGEMATTYVSQVDEDTYAEHGLTYYASIRSMARTPGHKTADDIFYPTFDPVASVLRCFRCHSTGSVTLGAGYSIQPGETGVRCEACHGPGAEHVRTGGQGGIRNPGHLNSVEVNEFCGTCHRKAPEAGEEKDWTNTWNVRHQPTSLSQAACFRKSAGMSCLTCHDPHGPLVRTAAEYDRRCSGCHRAVHHQTATAAGTCAGCHKIGRAHV